MVLLAAILYPIFLITLLFLCSIIALNGKRIRGKFKFDALPLYMVIYVVNVAYVFGLLGAGVYLLVFSTFLLLVVIVKVSKIQIISITGIIKREIFCNFYIGSTGSGKTSVTNMLSEDFKLEKIELNSLLKRVTRQKPISDALIKEFGGDILDDKKELNPKFLHETIFPREVIRKKFTKMLEIPLLKETLKEIYTISRRSKEIIVCDAPMLFDFRILPYVSYPNIVVYNTESALPVKRMAERDHISLSEATKLVATPQGQIGRMLKKADIQIKNDEDMNALKYKLIHQLGSYLL